MMPLIMKEMKKFSALLLYNNPVMAEPKITPISRNMNKVPTAFPLNPGNDKSTAQANNDGDTKPNPTPNMIDDAVYR